jgi:hypothetical protein
MRCVELIAEVEQRLSYQVPKHLKSTKDEKQVLVFPIYKSVSLGQLCAVMVHTEISRLFDPAKA